MFLQKLLHPNKSGSSHRIKSPSNPQDHQKPCNAQNPVRSLLVHFMKKPDSDQVNPLLVSSPSCSTSTPLPNQGGSPPVPTPNPQQIAQSSSSSADPSNPSALVAEVYFTSDETVESLKSEFGCHLNCPPECLSICDPNFQLLPDALELTSYLSAAERSGNIPALHLLCPPAVLDLLLASGLSENGHLTPLCPSGSASDSSMSASELSESGPESMTPHSHSLRDFREVGQLGSVSNFNLNEIIERLHCKIPIHVSTRGLVFQLARYIEINDHASISQLILLLPPQHIAPVLPILLSIRNPDINDLMFRLCESSCELYHFTHFLTFERDCFAQVGSKFPDLIQANPLCHSLVSNKEMTDHQEFDVEANHPLSFQRISGYVCDHVFRSLSKPAIISFKPHLSLSKPKIYWRYPPPQWSIDQMLEGQPPVDRSEMSLLSIPISNDHHQLHSTFDSNRESSPRLSLSEGSRSSDALSETRPPTKSHHQTESQRHGRSHRQHHGHSESPRRLNKHHESCGLKNEPSHGAGPLGLSVPAHIQGPSEPIQPLGLSEPPRSLGQNTPAPSAVGSPESSGPPGSILQSNPLDQVEPKDHLNPASGSIEPRILVKRGEDIYHESAIQVLFRLFNEIWTEYLPQKLRPRVCSFSELPMGRNIGFLEVIDDCLTLEEVETSHFMQIRNKDLFIRTSCGWILSAYILGLSDRHRENTLVRRADSSAIPIDFGFMLGVEAPSVNTYLITISEEMYTYLMEHGDWGRFCVMFLSGFYLLRRQANSIIALARCLFQDHRDIDLVDKFLKVRFLSDHSDSKAMKKIAKMLAHAPLCLDTKLKLNTLGFNKKILRTFGNTILFRMIVRRSLGQVNLYQASGHVHYDRVHLQIPTIIPAGLPHPLIKHLREIGHSLQQSQQLDSFAGVSIPTIQIGQTNSS